MVCRTWTPAAVRVEVGPAQAAQLAAAEAGVRGQLVERGQAVAGHVLEESRGLVRLPDAQVVVLVARCGLGSRPSAPRPGCS